MVELKATQARLATIQMTNRLEGRPRTADFKRAMKAEARDALWMLSKQWQVGEFNGDDAGSPILAKAHLKTTQLTKYRAGDGQGVPFNQEIPLEAEVERQPLVFERAGRPISFDLRLLFGRRWLKQATGLLGPTARAQYLARAPYQIEPPDPQRAEHASVCAHSAVWQQVAAVAGRAFDGYEFYKALKTNGLDEAHKDIDSASTPQLKADIRGVAEEWMSWVERLFLQPPPQGNPSWKPSYLEHQFVCSAPTGPTQEKILSAAEYHHGHLDWYNLDIQPGSEPLETDPAPEEDVQGTITRTFIPTSVTFPGMPHPRWWTFEDSNTDLSFVQPDTQDLNKLLLLDFFLIYSNDWFVVPVTLPVGTLTDVRGMMVTNVFGEKIWIEAAGRGADQDWQRFNLFTHAIAGSDDVPADMATVVLPVARKVQQGKPLEEIHLLRDEVANMVWAVETRIPAATGRGYSGKDAARELRERLQQLVWESHPPTSSAEANASVRYELVNQVPELWIPFVPVAIEGEMRAVQLQRAALPRVLKDDPSVPQKVEPRTSLLRHGLDDSPPAPYFLHEEEVTRAGTLVTKRFQRTRWYNGEVVTWLGIRKQQGRGEGRSGLAFDQLKPTNFEPKSDTNDG